MAPTLATITKLFQAFLPAGSDRLDASQKRKLQSILLYPPEYEPSSEEIQKRWNGMIERRELEHQLVMIEELERLLKELKDVVKSGENGILSNNHDQMMAFLMALHTPPNAEIIELANQWKEDRKTQIPPETESEMNMKLYRSIIEEEPFQGDHWQTDIYAGSSSSYSGSNASSDWNSTPEDIEAEKPLKEALQPTDSILDPIHSLGIVESAEDRQLRLEAYNETINDMKKREYWSTSEKLKPDQTIDELIAVRELLSVLQGLGADSIFCMSTVDAQAMQLVKNPPRLIHQSQSTSISVYQSFIPLLSSLQQIRKMSRTSTFDCAVGRSRTQEAFIASLIGLLQRFDTFIASVELRILNLPISQIQSTLEESKIGTVISLSRLYSDLNSLGWVELVPAIASSVLETATPDLNRPRHPGVESQQLLNSLYHTASHFNAHSNYPAAVEESKRVFLETFEPIWSWVGSWILHGRLPGQQPTDSLDSTQYLHNFQEDKFSTTPQCYLANEDSKEFFIQEIDDGNSWSSDHWWNTNHQIQDHIPEVLIEFVSEILEGGKARALSNLLQSGGQTGEILVDLWPNLMSFLSDDEVNDERLEPSVVEEGSLLKSFLLHPCAHTSTVPSYRSSSFRIGQEPPIRSIKRTDFKLELAKKLGTQISQRNQLNHQYLHTRFMSPSKLKSYIIGLNEFFLHGCFSSEIFINSIFHDFDEQFNSTLNSTNHVNSKRWYDTQIINQNLIKSLEFSTNPSSFIKLCLPKVKVLKPINSNDLQDPIKSLETLQIELSIPIPINYILNEDYILKNYNLIFIQLSQLSRSSKSLNQLILIKPSVHFTSSNGKSFEQQIESREFYKLKNRLNWFVNLLMDYYLNLVIGKFKLKILEGLEQGNLIELNEKVELVKDWMKRLMFLMFLSEECKAIHRIIIQLLRLCNTCGEVWKSFNLQANSLIFLNRIDERNVDVERRRRKEVRRKKRIELERYRLIDEEILMTLDQEEKEEEEEEAMSDDHSAPLHLSTFVLKRSDEDESFYDQFVRMNNEFEKLMNVLKRGIGRLIKRSSSSSTRKLVEDEMMEEEEELGKEGMDGLEGRVGEQDDLDCLMGLECRLDEWIP